MKHTALILFLAASTVAAAAQTPAKPATPPSTAAKPAVHAAAAPSPLIAAVIKTPASIPQHKGVQKPIFTVALRYQEIKIGTGALAEPGKVYKVLYTGYRAADGVKFDSTSDRPRPPLKDKDGKPVIGDDGKPKLGDIQPFPFHQGVGSTVPGFDQAFVGMKVGGQRRIFIPWQLAYGTKSIPDHGPEHPGIPAKADLIFDVELLDVADAPPPPPARPMGGMPIRPGMTPLPARPAAPGTPGAAPGAPNSGSAPVILRTPGTTPTPAAPGTPGAAPTPQVTPPPASPTPATPAPVTPPAGTPPATTTPPPATTPPPQSR